jgi:hypothetical protein
MSNLPYIVYGLRLANETGYRYVGITTVKPSTRFSQHVYHAFTAESPRAVYCWMRKYGRGSTVMVTLEECSQDWDYLMYAEKYWIKSLKEFGHKLLNHTEGGDGVRGLVAWNKGIPMTDAQKEHMREINTGKVLSEDHKNLIQIGVAKHFEANGHKSVYEFWVDKHGADEADRLWAEMRKQRSESMTGEGNHMFGKTGQDAPCYGRLGDKHPMYGTHHSEEVRARISASTKGKPKSELTKIRMSYANHIRFHASKIKTSCKWCLGADLQDELKKREIELNGDKVE